MAYRVAPAFAAHASLVLVGSALDLVSGAALAATGTVAEGSDAAGPYITAASGSGLKTVPLPRLTGYAGGCIVVRFRTSATGIKCLLGVGETGTATLESLYLNAGSMANVANGSGCLYLRATSGGATRGGYTGNIALNDGALHTFAAQIPASESGAISTLRAAVDGVEVPLSYNPSNALVIAAGTMGYGHGVLARNLRGTLDTVATDVQLYFLARLDGEHDILSLSANPMQIVELAGGAELAGGVAEPATAGGALTSGIPLAGGVDEAVGAGGALATGIALAGGVGEATTAAGALATAIPLAGGVDIDVSIGGALPLGGAGMSGALDIPFAAGGALATAIPLSGGIAVEEGVGADLAAGARVLAGGVAEPASAGGDLAAAILLAGGIAAEAGAGGALTTAPALRIPAPRVEHNNQQTGRRPANLQTGGRRNVQTGRRPGAR